MNLKASYPPHPFLLLLTLSWTYYLLLFVGWEGALGPGAGEGWARRPTGQSLATSNWPLQNLQWWKWGLKGLWHAQNNLSLLVMSVITPSLRTSAIFSLNHLPTSTLLMFNFLKRKRKGRRREATKFYIIDIIINLLYVRILTYQPTQTFPVRKISNLIQSQLADGCNFLFIPDLTLLKCGGKDVSISIHLIFANALTIEICWSW